MSASIVAQHLKAPAASDVLKFLRASGSQCLTVWRHDQEELRVISVSDAGGIGGPPTENGENVQNAHLILVADDEIGQGLHTKVRLDKDSTPKHHHSCGGPLGASALSTPRFWEKQSRCLQGVADAEWAQIMIQVALNQAVITRDVTRGTLRCQVVLCSDCILSNRLPLDHSIDAKSVFYAPIKECAGSRKDRPTEVDLAIVRETLKAQGSHIRWILHPLMPADSMTKVDPSTENDALRHLLRIGKLVWDEETIRRSAGSQSSTARRQWRNS